jgi:hypothetical protein
LSVTTKISYSSGVAVSSTYKGSIRDDPRL